MTEPIAGCWVLPDRRTRRRRQLPESSAGHALQHRFRLADDLPLQLPASLPTTYRAADKSARQPITGRPLRNSARARRRRPIEAERDPCPLCCPLILNKGLPILPSPACDCSRGFLSVAKPKRGKTSASKWVQEGPSNPARVSSPFALSSRQPMLWLPTPFNCT